MNKFSLTLASSLSKPRQSGAALIVSLLFLVMLTLVGISAMTTTTLEEKMSANARDYNVAFQSAEAALRDAWTDINSARISRVTGFGTSCAEGLCERSSTTSIPVWNSINWSASGLSVPYGSKTGAVLLPVGPGGATTLPRYILEAFVDPKSSLVIGKQTYLYRATARGYGASDAAQVTVQTTYRPQ